ncbi:MULTISPECIES: hypothetical protein [Streptomyces]|nr:hypothetical protein [Streptomyces sp. NEAU-HV9]
MQRRGDDQFVVRARVQRQPGRLQRVRPLIDGLCAVRQPREAVDQ